MKKFISLAIFTFGIIYCGQNIALPFDNRDKTSKNLYPGDERVISYVRNTWGIYADLDLLKITLEAPDPDNASITLNKKISIFLLAIDIADKAERGDYRGAVESGLAWSIPSSVSYVGFPWLAAAGNFGYRVYKIGNWLLDEFDRMGLNGQFEYYFYYRDKENCSHQQLVSDGCEYGFRDGWLHKPKSLLQFGLPSHKGRLKPAEFFEIARYLYDAARLENNRRVDEEALKRQVEELFDSFPNSAVYLKSWNALFSEEKNVDQWLIQYDGPMSMTETVNIGGIPYKLNSICKRHDCGANFFVVLFAPNGSKAWGFFKKDYKDGRFFGQPDDVKKSMLRTIVKCVQETGQLICR